MESQPPIDDHTTVERQLQNPKQANSQQAQSLMQHKLVTQGELPLMPLGDHLYAAMRYNDLAIMVQEGKISCFATSFVQFFTTDGIKLGDPVANLDVLFGPKLHIKPSNYDENGFYYVWTQDQLRRQV